MSFTQVSFSADEDVLSLLNSNLPARLETCVSTLATINQKLRQNNQELKIEINELLERQKRMCTEREQMLRKEEAMTKVIHALSATIDAQSATFSEMAIKEQECGERMNLIRQSHEEAIAVEVMRNSVRPTGIRNSGKDTGLFTTMKW